MITHEQIIQDLEEIFKSHDISDEQFVLDDSFFNQGMNSLDEVEFLMAVESKYGISIDDKIADHIKRPSDYIELILEAVNQKAPE